MLCPGWLGGSACHRLHADPNQPKRTHPGAGRHQEMGEFPGAKTQGQIELRQAFVQQHAVVRLHSARHIDGDTLGVTVGRGSLIGPYARLRPGAWRRHAHCAQD